MMNIVKMYFGSHLYGTATEDSDLDYKGVFLPSKEQIFLGNIPKSYSYNTKKDDSKNTKDDVDSEIYSLHYFVKLACEGQTVAIDMLHAPKNMIIEKSEIWDNIVYHKDKFYTRNLKAFIGYARRQASKYGIKGSRLSAAKEFIDFLKSYREEIPLKEVWDLLPTGEHIHFDIDPNGLRVYQICGKKFQETARVGYILPIMEKFYDSYGKRAKQAEENKGIDWKAVSHAIRAALQVRQLLTEHTITFPLENADYLLKVKQGNVDYTTEAAPYLEQLMDEVEKLTEKSTLPMKPDKKFWDQFIIDTVESYVL